jgi:hypothetical protein
MSQLTIRRISFAWMYFISYLLISTFGTRNCLPIMGTIEENTGIVECDPFSSAIAIPSTARTSMAVCSESVK